MKHQQVCTRCNLQKNREVFPPNKKIKRGTGSWCRDCVNDHTKAYRAKLPKEKTKLKNRKQNLKKKYGIELEQYDKIVEIQEGKCAICHRSKFLVVDHNHITNEVRGLICSACNIGIGNLQDDINILQRAINYLVGNSIILENNIVGILNNEKERIDFYRT